LHLDARLEGPSLLVEDLLKLEPGHVLNFDYPVGKPLRLVLNGQDRYEGQLVACRNKKSFQVERLSG
jgi:flagellar motor switch protein FliM